VVGDADRVPVGSPAHPRIAASQPAAGIVLATFPFPARPPHRFLRRREECALVLGEVLCHSRIMQRERKDGESGSLTLGHALAARVRKGYRLS